VTATTHTRPTTTPTEPAPPPVDFDVEAIVGPVYRERAEVVADLAARWPAVLVLHAPDLPAFAILHVHAVTGPMTWHIHHDHLPLLDHVRRVPATHPWRSGTDTTLLRGTVKRSV